MKYIAGGTTQFQDSLSAKETTATAIKAKTDKLTFDAGDAVKSQDSPSIAAVKAQTDKLTFDAGDAVKSQDSPSIAAIKANTDKLTFDGGNAVKAQDSPSIAAIKANTDKLTFDGGNAIKTQNPPNLVDTATPGTYNHPDGVVEQDVLEFAAAVQDIEVRLDLNALAQDTTFKEYEKVDGVNYRQVSSKIYPTDTGTNKVISFSFKQANRAYKITAKSGVAEGAIRAIPYVYRTEGRA